MFFWALRVKLGSQGCGADLELARCRDSSIDDRIADLVRLGVDHLGSAQVQVVQDGVLFCAFVDDLDDRFGLLDVGIPHDLDGLGCHERRADRFLDQRHDHRGVHRVLLERLVERLPEGVVHVGDVLRLAKEVDVDHHLFDHREREVPGDRDGAVNADVERDLRAELGRLEPPHEETRLVGRDPVVQVLDQVGAFASCFRGVVIIALRDVLGVLGCDFDDVLHHRDRVDHVVELLGVLGLELLVAGDDSLAFLEIGRDDILGVLDERLDGLDVPEELPPEGCCSAEDAQEALANVLVLGDELGVLRIVLVLDVAEALVERLQHLRDLFVLAGLDVFKHHVDEGVQSGQCIRTVGRDDQRVLDHGDVCPFGIRLRLLRSVAFQHVLADKLLARFRGSCDGRQVFRRDVGYGELCAHGSPCEVGLATRFGVFVALGVQDIGVYLVIHQTIVVTLLDATQDGFREALDCIVASLHNFDGIFDELMIFVRVNVVLHNLLSKLKLVVEDRERVGVLLFRGEPLEVCLRVATGRIDCSGHASDTFSASCVYRGAEVIPVAVCIQVFAIVHHGLHRVIESSRCGVMDASADASTGEQEEDQYSHDE